MKSILVQAMAAYARAISTNTSTSKFTIPSSLIPSTHPPNHHVTGATAFSAVAPSAIVSPSRTIPWAPTSTLSLFWALPSSTGWPSAITGSVITQSPEKTVYGVDACPVFSGSVTQCANATQTWTEDFDSLTKTDFEFLPVFQVTVKPSATMVQMYFPGAPTLVGGQMECGTLVPTEKARCELVFAEKWVWPHGGGIFELTITDGNATFEEDEMTYMDLVVVEPGRRESGSERLVVRWALAALVATTGAVVVALL